MSAIAAMSPYEGKVFYHEGNRDRYFKVAEVMPDGELRLECCRAENPFDPNEWYDWRSIWPKDFEEKYVEFSPETWAIASAAVATGDLSSIVPHETPADDTETGLMSMDGNRLALVHAATSSHLRRLENIHAVMRTIIEVQKAKMDALRSRLSQSVASLQAQMKVIQKVITVVELLEGVNEELVQLRAGNSASPDEPIHIYQLTMYADEEIALQYMDFDFTQIEKFDKWIADPKNSRRFIDAPKGIAVFKPRRKEKDYGDAWENAAMNVWNREPYILIKNGENLYRICSPHLRVGERVFPSSAEAESLLHPDGHEATWDKQKREDMLFDYKRFGIVIQGLVNRTQIFAPMPYIRFFDLGEHEHLVRFVYDSENLIGDGRETYPQWVAAINANIKQGSRIFFAGIPAGEGYGLRRDLYYHLHRHFKRGDWTYLPDSPGIGVYTVEKVTDDAEVAFLYLPGSRSWEERKRRVMFYHETQERYPRVINYDGMSLEDVNYYLNSRTERPNYLYIFPLLLELRKQMIEEKEKEGEFVKLILSQCPAATEAAIWEAIEWWKLKNKWKRSLTTDDALALRMIVKKLQK